MIIDARSIATSAHLQSDVCVVGAGAAGIPLAMELADAGTDVILLEAGGRWQTRIARDAYAGEVNDSHPPLHQYRARRLGGTTTLWGGRCLPFDDVDFRPRDWIPNSGWPLSPAELEPFYRRAHDPLELGEYAYRVSAALPASSPAMIPGFDSSLIETDKLERWSPPVSFADTYRQRLRKDPAVRLLLNATCSSLNLAATGDRVASIDVVTRPGIKFKVMAKYFVLASGGLEVTRLLLASRGPNRRAIGDHSGMLGRFYMTHLTGSIGEVRFSRDDVVTGYERSNDGVYVRRHITVGESGQRSESLVNMYAYVDRPLMGDAGHRSGILSTGYLAQVLRTLMQRHEVPPVDLKGHLANIGRDLPSIAVFLPRFFRVRYLSERRVPSIMMAGDKGLYALWFHSEQIPNPDSRITLTKKKDRLGMRRLRVEWKKMPDDDLSIRRTHELLQAALADSGSGRIVFRDTGDGRGASMPAGGHHIGSTRMSSDPDEGVVDADLRVHRMENLFVCSSSVFPTGGRANPTLTIVALGLRLADHLRKKLS